MDDKRSLDGRTVQRDSNGRLVAKDRRSADRLKWVGIGAGAGAILGAMYPTTVDHDWYRVVEVVNDHNLVAIANDLAQLRH